MKANRCCDCVDDFCRHRGGRRRPIRRARSRSSFRSRRAARPTRRAHHGRAHEAVARPAGHHRECRRRRRQHRVGRVARAEPDGYTIDIGQWDTHVASIIYPLTYDLQKDFEPIGLMSLNPQLMVGKKTLPADDLKDLVAWMKANPGKITFVNQNAAAQVSGILFEKLTGRRCTSFPIAARGPAMTDLVAGQVDLLVVQAAVALPQVRAGTIKALANLSPQRSAAVPDIPTSDEAACRASTFQDGSASSRRRARRRTSSPSSMPRWWRRLPTRLARALHRARPRRRPARAADAGRARRLPQGRDREMVADHQGRRHQGRVKHGWSASRLR